MFFEDSENKNTITVYLLCDFIIDNSFFQSLLDWASSLVFLISTVTITDVHQIHNTGILGWIECRLWNSEFVYFGLFFSSTWNIVVLTVERFAFLDSIHSCIFEAAIALIFFLVFPLARLRISREPHTDINSYV